MNEKEFAELNEGLRARQEAARKRNALPKRVTVNAVKSTPRQDPFRQQRLHRQRLAQTIKTSIGRVIPPLYQKARLFHLSGKFKADLLSHRDNIGLVLCGNVGTGKTYSVCALARTFIASGRSVVRVNYPELCLEIRDTFRKDSAASELTVLKKYLSTETLIIEDVGAGKDYDARESEFSLRLFYVLLNKRLEQMKQTIITTNHAPNKLAERFDERIESRLRYFHWIACGGSDMRSQMKERDT